jgi:hypothetical protein
MRKLTYFVLFLLVIALYAAMTIVSKKLGWNFSDYRLIDIATIIAAGIVFLCVFIHWLTQRLSFGVIESTQDPDEKISKIDKFIKKNASFKKDFSEMKQHTASLKISLLTMAAQAYMTKDDYKSAMARLDEAKTLFSVMGDLKIKGPMMDCRDRCLLTECVCMAYVGKIDEAERQMSVIMTRLDTTSEMAVAETSIARAELAICAKDAAGARKAVNQALPIMKMLADKYRKKDIFYEGMLMDGIVDGLEGNLDSAKRKLREAADNLTNYGDKRRAKKELFHLSGWSDSIRS